MTDLSNPLIELHKEKPFFLYLAHSLPHIPLFAHPDRVGKSQQGIYGDVIEEIDWSVGRILSTLKELELDTSTVVVFTSDNGPWLAFKTHGGSAGPLRAGKGWLYEGGIRIPQLIKTSVKRKAYLDLLFIPWISVLTFFVITYAFKLEGFICLLILALPFIVLGTLIAFIVRIFKINSVQRKKKTLISFLLLPVFLSPMEDYIPSPSKDYTVRNEVEILASKQVIWDHIIEVDQIDEKEYNAGAFQYLGIPRPIEATVSYKGVGATRIGKFSGGLKFVEIIEIPIAFESSFLISPFSFTKIEYRSMV